MRRVRLTLGYDGTEFWGSQSQARVRTVQDELELLLQRVAPGSGRTVFAGRTDKGVHAIGQVVSVDVTWKGSDEALRNALNQVGPVDLAVREVETVHRAFHARFDASAREYRYRVRVAPTPPVFERRYVWWRTGRLDGRLAAEAAVLLVGTRAYGTFAGNSRSQRLTAEQLTRTVSVCDWSWRPNDEGEQHELRVVANGFLPQMVRNVVAALVDIGRGARPIAWIDELLGANDRRALGEPAPPQGLVLWQVDYAGDGDSVTGRMRPDGNGEYGED